MPYEDFYFISVRVPVAELKRCFPQHPKEEERRGAPAKFEWTSFHTEIAVRAELDGLPPKQAELEREMALWCEDTWGQAPAESVLRERIAPIYRHPRKAGKGRK
jgi:hypothetical protein